MVCSSQNNVAYPRENSVAAPKTPYIQSQTTYPGTRTRVTHGIAQHVPARRGRQAKLAVRAVHDPDQLS